MQHVKLWGSIWVPRMCSFKRNMYFFLFKLPHYCTLLVAIGFRNDSVRKFVLRDVGTFLGRSGKPFQVTFAVPTTRLCPDAFYRQLLTEFMQAPKVRN